MNKHRTAFWMNEDLLDFDLLKKEIFGYGWLLAIKHFCSVLGKSHLGAKCDFEIWAFKVFFFGQEKHPLEWLLEAQT